eukprot:7954833-Karenia_brevis.AAC.1
MWTTSKWLLRHLDTCCRSCKSPSGPHTNQCQGRTFPELAGPQLNYPTTDMEGAEQTMFEAGISDADLAAIHISRIPDPPLPEFEYEDPANISASSTQ